MPALAVSRALGLTSAALAFALCSRIAEGDETNVGPAERSAAGALDLPPWREAGDLPLPPWARSVIVDRDEVAISSDPSGAAPRRGTAARGARLPFFGAKRGHGCAARWINVGPLAWVCQDAIRLDAAFAPADATSSAAPDGLPFHYFFVGALGASGYYRLDGAGDEAPDQRLEPGFSIAETDEAVKDGEPYIRTSHGSWVSRRDLVAVVPFAFRGQELAAGDLRVGWVVEDKVPIFSSPGKGKADPSRALARFDKVDILEEKPAKDGGYVRVADGQWLRARDVRWPAPAAAPAAIKGNERWIDVDLARQVLVAYEGARPLYATLVSTGIGKEGTDTATPVGEFRIWVKLKSSDMDNLDDEHADKYYAVEQVPFVQYFAKGVGLHGAFWHRAFGHVRSHGCVNLAPLDAEWLFAFTSPRLPHGWTAVVPTDVGTMVRVR